MGSFGTRGPVGKTPFNPNKKVEPTTTTEATTQGKGKQPDFIMKQKGTSGKYEKIGAAWKNDHGSLELRLDNDPEFFAILFVNDYEAKFGKKN